jgi:hypothetical protein
MWFLYVKWQIRRVPDTRLKPNGYGYEYEFLPAGMSTGTNFYPQPLYWRAGNCSTRPKPDSLPSLFACVGKAHYPDGSKEVWIRSWRRHDLCSCAPSPQLLEAWLPLLRWPTSSAAASGGAELRRWGGNRRRRRLGMQVHRPFLSPFCSSISFFSSCSFSMDFFMVISLWWHA